MKKLTFTTPLPKKKQIAEVVELVDTHVSGACVRKDMRVRVPPSAQSSMGVGVCVCVKYYQSSNLTI
jgi:hypothetical protein